MPLVVFFHGGWWKSEYDLGYAGYLCAALKKEGIATWSVEYRRVGDPGGGWPGTFQDVAAGFDFVANLAKSYPVDLSLGDHDGPFGGRSPRVLGSGEASHRSQQRDLSTAAAGPLAWGDLTRGSARSYSLTIDLSGYSTFAHDKQEVFALMGGHPQDLPDRYIRQQTQETSCRSMCLSS